MAPRFTDKQKKKIITDYINLGTYSAVAKKHGTSHQTIKRIVTSDEATVRKIQQKKDQNTLDMIAFMDSRKQKAQDIIDQLLEAMPQKIDKASLVQIGTVFGILVDKTTSINSEQKQDEGVKVIIDVGNKTE